MKQILFLTIIYVFILIIQYIYLNYFVSVKHSGLKKKIDWNNNNIENLIHDIDDILIKRINELKKMSYDTWIKYNNKNVFVTIHYNKYYLFGYENLEHNHHNRYITKIHANKTYIDLSWDDVLKDIDEKLINLKHSTDKNLISDSYNISDLSSPQTIKYYWIDPLSKRPVIKLSRVIRYSDEKSGRSGVIGIGIDLKDLSVDNSYVYWQKISWGCPVFISIFVYISSILIYKINGDRNIHYKSLFFLLIMNIYLTYYLGNSEINGTSLSEHKKEQNINSGIMSISFLFAVNIFILTTLQKSFKSTLFTESGFIFSLSILLLLLFAMIKKTDNKTTNDLISNRLCTQLLFNASIILNMLIIFNYILYVLSIKLGKKIIK